MRLHQVGQHVRELGLLLQGRDAAGPPTPGQQPRERVQVVGVDVRDVRVRDDDVGQVAERVQAVRESHGEE